MMVVASEGGAKKEAAEKRATETVSRLDSFKEGVDLQVRTIAQTISHSTVLNQTQTISHSTVLN